MSALVLRMYITYDGTGRRCSKRDGHCFELDGQEHVHSWLTLSNAPDFKERLSTAVVQRLSFRIA